MKKIIALVLALMMVLSLVACGNDTGKTPSGSTDPGTSQQEQSNIPENNEDQNETPPQGDTSMETPLFGWTEDDIKPDDIFNSMKTDEDLGYVISISEPLGADGYKAWYEKLLSKSAEFADGGNLYDIMGNSIDVKENVLPALENNIEMLENGAGPFYVMWYYEANGKKISIATSVQSFDDTEDVMSCLIKEFEGL